MARLQDFPTVTPTSSDKLLVVQSQGQGLVPYGSKLDSANPTGTGSLSLNRIGNTGSKSVAIGNNVTASNYYSFAEGSSTVASGIASHAEGNENTASANSAHAEGYNCVASGNYSHAQGNGTIANHLGQTALGAFNLEDGTADAGSRGTYIEIVGKGTSNNARSNARTLDWSGNEVLAGDLTIQGNVSLGLKTYSTTQNGVTYDLFMMGKMGILTVKTGSLTNAVSGNSTLVTLTDFSSDFTGKKFASSFQFNPTTDTSKRFDCGSNTNTLITVHNLAAGYAPRGCVPVVII